jgi:N-acetylglucosaminyl-diphospho-decaprenol L-rhamnosyltransferase
MADIAIVIVTYNSAREIGACLDAARNTGVEIVVVDNASTDETRAEVQHRGVPLIENRENRGFAAAVNQGFAALNCEYVLLLNPDAVILTGLEPLRQACERPGVAAAGGMLIDAAGRAQTGFTVRRFPTVAVLILEALLLNRLWPGNPVNRKYRMLDFDSGVACDVQQPAGAFLMLRKSVWEKLGGLDEGFVPVWFEDVDLCRRAVQLGYTLRYVPGAVAKHTGAHSIAGLEVEKRNYYWYRSLLRYSAKHFRPISFRAVCLGVFTGSIVRGLTGVLMDRSLKSLQDYRKVAGLAWRSLWSGWRETEVSGNPI